MIRPEQLAAALERIDPRDRELLSLSLRRRVPDEALARVYDVEPQVVARRRAAAIERLADELEVQRGEDLGSVLQALLEPETWSVGEVTMPGEEFVGGIALGSSTQSPPVDDPGGPGAASQSPEASPADDSPGGRRVKARGGSRKDPGPSDPVFERLTRRERGSVGIAERRAPHVALALAGVVIAALVSTGGFVGATQFGADENSSAPGRPAADEGARDFVPARGGPLAAPFPSEPQTVSCYSTAYVTRAATLYRDPDGPELIKLPARTEWGSPRVLGVVRQRGDWLGVQAPELRNDELGWLPASQARVDCVRWSLHTDLSRRVLYVRKDGHTVSKFKVAIGSRSHPTPKGRFSVTDKLKVTDQRSPYGCCVMALSGHQTRLPSSWPGGDRLAVHATTDRASIGKPVSLGCMRTDPRRARWLLEKIPLGAPIFIRS